VTLVPPGGKIRIPGDVHDRVYFPAQHGVEYTL
jgi:hypothetical protein